MEKKMLQTKLKTVRTFEELLEVALWEIQTGGFDTMISFPIHTGGLGNASDNIRHAQQFIQQLGITNFKIWNQIPYLNQNLSVTPKMTNMEWMFNRFYIPLIRSRVFTQFIMLPGWESSVGCRTEHTEAISIGAKIFYVDNQQIL